MISVPSVPVDGIWNMSAVVVYLTFEGGILRFDYNANIVELLGPRCVLDVVHGKCYGASAPGSSSFQRIGGGTAYLSVCLFVHCCSLPLEPWIQAVMHAYNSWFPEGFSVEPRFHNSLD